MSLNSLFFSDSSRCTWGMLMSSVPKPPRLFLVLLSATHGFSSAHMQRGAHETSTTSTSLRERAQVHTSHWAAARLAKRFLSARQHSKTFILMLLIHVLSVLQHPNINLFLPSIFQVVLHPSLHPQCSRVWLSKGLMSHLAIAQETKTWTSVARPEKDGGEAVLYSTRRERAAKWAKNARHIQKFTPEELLFIRDLK